MIWAGLGLALLGVLVVYVPGLFSWFGNLPGDIKVETEDSRVFIPITSMIVVSVALTIVVNVVGSFFSNR